MKLEVYHQYENTNIEELLQGIQDIRNKYIQGAVDSFISDVFNLRTAIGDGLDCWGKLLKFPRYLPIPTERPPELGNVQEFSFYDRKTFSKLQFHQIKVDDYLRLPDFAYRLLLTMLLQKQNVFPNVIEMSKLNKDVFASIGINILVQDSEKMDYVILLADKELPPWLDYVLKHYDIILRPLCVGSKLVVNLRKPIGFYRNLADDPIKSSKEITNFRYGNFEEKDKEE